MDELEKLKQQVNLLDYIRQHNPSCKVKRVGIDTQISPCPFCDKGVKSPHFTIYERTNTFKTYGSGCNKNGVTGGTIVDYLIATENLTTAEAINKLYEITNTPREKFNPRATQEKQPQKPQEKKPSKEELQQVSDFIKQGIEQMQEQDKKELADYLNKRQISEDAISKYHLFLKEDKAKNKRVYIPIYEQGQAVAYLGRAIKDDVQPRYMNSQGTIRPFNIDYLSQEAETEDEPLFICEGVFDAIVIEEQGKKAIALNGTPQANKLIEVIKQNKDKLQKYKFIIATDTDEARKNCTRNNNKRAYRHKHSKQLFADTTRQGRKRVVL